MGQALLFIAGSGGQIATKGWSYTLSSGIAPSSLTFTMDPTQGNTPLAVTGVSILETGGASVPLPDMKLASVSLVKGSGGRLASVTYHDRRWRWKYGIIHGSYNVPKTVAGVDALQREKTPQELAVMLLDAMGESGYDVSRLDNTARPEVDWQRVNPAQELQSLCDGLGTLVIYNPIANRVELWPIGQGGGLPPDADIIDQSSPATIAENPGQIRVIGGPIRFQSRFSLGEPLGYETDGKLKPIDDLSYKPENGWENASPTIFQNIKGTYTPPSDPGRTLYLKDLAGKGVWKIYQITGRANGGGWVPSLLAGGEFEPTGVDDLDFDSVKISKTSGPDGVDRPEPAEVYGCFGRRDMSITNLPDGTIYPNAFTIDNERNLVVFNEPVFKYDKDADAGKTQPADLELITAYTATKDGVIVRYEHWLDNSGDSYGAGEKLLPHPEIVREIVEDGGSSEVTEDNEADVIAASLHYINAEIAALSGGVARDIRYEGLIAGQVDGVVRQVTWSGGGGAEATTRLSINQESNPYVPSWRERRRQNESLRETARSQNANPKAKDSKR